MNRNEIRVAHKNLVANTFKKIDGRGGKQELIHGCMGLMGEVGELIDAFKKHVYYGKQLDLSNVVEELGDIAYYIEAIRQNLGVDELDILEGNLVKLEKRYPGQVFTESRAIERADKVENPAAGQDMSNGFSTDPTVYSKNLGYQEVSAGNVAQGSSHKPFTAEHRDFLDASAREEAQKRSL